MVERVSPEETELAFSGPAVAANRFFVHVMDSWVRVAFLEQTPDTPPVFRKAVVLSIPDAILLAGLLNQLIAEVRPTGLDQASTPLVLKNG
jgi:hypothetical protein